MDLAERLKKARVILKKLINCTSSKLKMLIVYFKGLSSVICEFNLNKAITKNI